MHVSRFSWALLMVLSLSCADSGGPVFVDAQWNLTCSSGGDCGSLAPETCLGASPQRAIVGEHGQTACTEEPILAICEAVDRADGTRFISLEANVGNEFAFELDAIIAGDGSVEQSSCNVTIVEDELPYDLGACGSESPSIMQPCQLSNVSAEGNEVTLDLQCAPLLSSTTGFGFDVDATIRFANCTGF
jgi:hypothetical protein